MSKPRAVKQKETKIKADRSSTKVDGASRAARGKLMKSVGAQSPLWQGTIKATGEDVIAAGDKIDADDVLIAQLELQLGAAKDNLVHDQGVFDSKFDIFVGTVEDNVTSPKEMQDLGLDPLVEKKYALAAPLGLTAKSDPVLHDISVLVKRAPGMERCDIEVSSDLTMQTGVKQFPGDGLRQKMGPFPPGTYAVRARHIRANERSAYTDIVMVIVK